MKNKFPQVHPLFDRLMATLSILAIAGLYIDGWAHNHGAVDDTFFTIYHAVMYGAYGLIALTLSGLHFYNVNKKGYPFFRALPRGYNISLAGAALFIAGGAGDAVWHSFFGFEGGVEILISPAHLVLFGAYMLILFGTIYARWSHEKVIRGWRQLWDIVFLWLAVFGVITFTLQYAHFLHALEYLVGVEPTADVLWIYNEFGATSFILTGVIVAAIWLIMVRRWQLPFGAFTVLIAANTFMMAGMVINDYGAFAGEFEGIMTLVVVSAAGALIGDIIVYWLKPSPQRLLRMHLSAFILPALATLFFIIAVEVFGQIAFGEGLWWRIHLLIGLPGTAGCIGLLLSMMMYPPPVPEKIS